MNEHVETFSGPVPRDAVFSLLSPSRRRALIRVLAAHDRELTLNDVTKEIVTREAETDITDVPREEVLRVATSLYHEHVPRLADAGVVRYNPRRKLIEPTEKLAPVASHLESLSERVD